MVSAASLATAGAQAAAARAAVAAAFGESASRLFVTW